MVCSANKLDSVRAQRQRAGDSSERGLALLRLTVKRNKKKNRTVGISSWRPGIFISLERQTEFTRFLHQTNRTGMTCRLLGWFLNVPGGQLQNTEAKCENCERVVVVKICGVFFLFVFCLKHPLVAAERRRLTSAHCERSRQFLTQWRVWDIHKPPAPTACISQLGDQTLRSYTMSFLAKRIFQMLGPVLEK